MRRDRDRHGNSRVYLRVPGRKQVRLREPPGGAAFIAEYQSALAALEGARPEAAAPHGSLGWLWSLYKTSPEWQALAPRTRHVRALVMAPLLAEHGANPIAALEVRHVETLRDARADRPGAANSIVKALRQLLGWAVKRRRLERNVAAEVPYLGAAKPGGFRAWTPDDLERFRAFWPVSSKPRLAVELLAQTGVRRSDVVRLGPPMVRNGFIVLTESKNRGRAPKVTEIPLLSALEAVIAATPSAHGHLVWLVTEGGKPYSAEGFSNWFRARCREAGLADCPAHGLRKLAAASLADAGATPHQMMAWFGWTGSKMAEHYSKTADRRRLAGQARALLEGAVLSHPSAAAVPPSSKALR
jgi:integrase